MSLDLRTDGAKRGEFRAEVAVESCANAGWKDQRFEGQIVKYLVDKGYGFIRCQELRQSRYPDRDIFLHQKQLGNFKEGDAVSFGIFLNRDGKPQATELAYLNGGGEQQYQQQGQYPQQSQQYQQQSQHQQYPQEYQQQQYQQYSQQQYQQGQYQQYSQEYQSQDHYGMQGQGGDQEPLERLDRSNLNSRQSHQASMGEWPPQPPQEEEGTHEVEVPKDLVSQLEGGTRHISEGPGIDLLDHSRLHQLKQMAGGDIQIAFQTRPDHSNPVAVVKGPKAHASLAAILVMQELCDLIQIPV
ncbi:unnamed protein product [Durusdinium trenchii]|uniref:CSD domain-containing protein n=1 Tax=Durusdinium trenchii TaxID=1381693 RepID=A0ABP0NYZ5_9DINO